MKCCTDHDLVASLDWKVTSLVGKQSKGEESLAIDCAGFYNQISRAPGGAQHCYYRKLGKDGNDDLLLNPIPEPATRIHQ